MNLKKVTAVFTASIFICGFSMGSAYSAAKGTSKTLYNNEIGRGTSYTQKVITDNNIKQVLNIVTSDLNDLGTDIVFSKAKDIEKKEEVLSRQMQRETFKGNNVVAGINADMFDMGTGFSSGPQIRDGAIITAHNAKSEENIYPVFGIDNNKQAFITYLHMDAKLTLPGAVNNATTEGAIVNDNSISIDNFNRENFKDKLIVCDTRLNEKGIIDFTKYASNGALTIVKGINEPIKLGVDYEGTVETVGFGSKSVTIPRDGIVLASNGTKAQWIKNHLKPGDKLSIKVNYDKDNIADAVGAYTYFLRNGRVLSNEEMIKAGANSSLVYARKSRTAIGITADNRVIAITVDGGQPSKGISDGITLYEMANQLKSLGAVDGVGFDGGGSTEMGVKLYGETNISIVNKPSDGRERALTNGVVFVSNNERSYEIGDMSITGGDVTLFENTSYRFRAKGMDTSYNPLDLTNASLNWNADSGIGTIDGTGLFRSGNMEGSGRVTAFLGKVSAGVNVKVVGSLASLALTDKTIVPLQPGVYRQFNLEARDSSGSRVIIENKAAQWNITGNLGKIDENGLLTVTASAGTGQVTAKVGNKIAAVKVAIMQNSEVIDDFEHGDSSRYIVNGYIGGVGSISSDYAKSGLYSYKISYDYDKQWDRKLNGTINLIPTYTDKDGNDLTANYTSTLRPKKLGLWVYGDGHAPWLRAELIDGDSNVRTIDLAKKIDWVGWKYVDADIPADIPYPFTLKTVYAVETNKGLHYRGNIYLDDLSFMYSDLLDVKGPEFSNFSPSGTIYSQNASIGVTVSDRSGVEKRTLWAKLDGKSVLARYDEATGRLTYDAKFLGKGAHTFEVQASDILGNRAYPGFKGVFTVSDLKDTKAPVISKLFPGNKSTIKIQTPRITVNIKDDKAGVNPGDINIFLDKVKINTYYNETSALAWAVPEKPLQPGTHTISLTVRDRAGNKASLQTISFNVQPFKQPLNPNSFTFSVLSDSHATEFGYEFFNTALNDGSELVIQNGDMIDGDTTAQWSEGLKQAGIINNKPVMLSPGNHEASNGNDNNYIKYFGSPTYSFEFGNSLFISLNSSLGQSITASDPTQFEYLEKLLSANRKQNIFIYTHVPTRDSLGTGHQMLKADADKLEKLLGDYKKANTDKNINVIFGHMHAFQSWAVSGVNYIIDGNECLKKYVNPENGGYLGYTKFTVNGSKTVYKFVPMAQSIAVMDGAVAAKEMKVIRGTKKMLSLYGDFKLMSADYISPINNIKNVDVKWESENPSVVSISEDGVISANSVGSTSITAAVLNNTYKFKITSEEQRQEYIIGFRISSSAGSLNPGQSIKLNAVGYDLYGNSFNVDTSQIIWQTSSGSINNGVYVAPQDAAPDKIIDLTAQYMGYTSKISLKTGNVVNKKYAVITATSLNIRDSASISGNIIGKLVKGDRVEVIGQENDWFKIVFNGKTGYISKQYAKLQ